MRFDGQVRAKKHLGQHFLKDESIAGRIAAVVPFEGVEKVLEVGPGMGMMTKYLLRNLAITQKTCKKNCKKFNIFEKPFSQQIQIWKNIRKIFKILKKN